MSSPDKFAFIKDEALRNAVKCALSFKSSEESGELTNEQFLDEIVKRAIEDKVLYIEIAALEICAFSELDIGRVIAQDPLVTREGDSIKISLKLAEPQRGRKKKREVKVAVPVAPKVEEAPLSFISVPELKSIIICLLRYKYDKSNLSIDFNQYLQRESRAAEEVGFLETNTREWTGCATLQKLNEFEILRLVQVIESDVPHTPRRILIPTKIPRDVVVTARYLGESIRNWLLLNDNGSPSEFWQFVWRRLRPDSSYAAIVKYFHVLEVLGLIEKTEKKSYQLFDKNHHGTDARVFYKIVLGREADPHFRSAQQELYPATVLGGRRYNKAKEQGRVQFGRNPKYS